MFNRIIIAGAALLMVSACAPQETGLDIAAPETLNGLIDAYVEDGYYPFVYARLEGFDGNVIYEHGANNPDFVPEPVDGDDWIRVWSMSKIVTISTVMDLVEDGALSLDDPVTKYIPEFENLLVAVGPEGESLSGPSLAAWGDADVKAELATLPCALDTAPMSEEMTVLDLINHKAGFYYAVTNIPCMDDALAGIEFSYAESSDDLIARMATLPLIQQPGERYYYGTNTTVLGFVAERATGKSLKELVGDRMGSLGIEGLQYGLPMGETLPPRVTGVDGTLRLAEEADLGIFGGDVPGYAPDSALYLGGEGMVATPDGYADFIRMFGARGELNGYRMLDDATITEMTAPHTETESQWGHNGYNVWVNSGKISGGRMGRGGLWIGGGYEGTHFWIDSELGFVGVIVSQIVDNPPGAAPRDETIREAVYDQLLIDGERFREAVKTAP